MSLLAVILSGLFAMAADTLSSAYAEKWQGTEGFESSNVIMQAMASNNLIFIVLGVSLIIWFVLIAYLVRIEKKLDRLELDRPEQDRPESE